MPEHNLLCKSLPKISDHTRILFFPDTDILHKGTLSVRDEFYYSALNKRFDHEKKFKNPSRESHIL